MILQDCPDVLVTDWMMPGLDGLELCRRVRQLYGRKVLPHYIYILLLTSHTGRNFFLEGLEAGADNFVEKTTQSLFDLRVEIKAHLRSAMRIRKLESDLEFAAKYDSLTALLNRVAFFDQAANLWERSIKNKFPLSAVMFDCDFFKRVNDIHGHQAGDTVLREVATLTKGFSRDSDMVCRYGGEEFCVLLPSCNEKSAWNWAERLREQFQSNPIKHENLEINVTASFGIAERFDDVLHLDQLVERADQALLFAKESGRNRCTRYSEIVACSNDFTKGGVGSLFVGATAEDVLTPFTLSIKPTETVASVANFFLETNFETLPVVDGNENLIGVVSENNFAPLVGNIGRWQEPIADLISPNVISYPLTTPLKVIYDFICRVSARQILIVDENKPVGFVNQTQLLRWLRNRWAVLCDDFESIIPSNTTRDLPYKNLRESVHALMKELCQLDTELNNGKAANATGMERMNLVSLISQSQDVMDQVLKFSTAPSENAVAGGSLAQMGFV
jgi:diguanylate cyclase (GGDEF)-like protein